MRDEHQVAMGGQIAGLREQQGWSQRALAKWVGLESVPPSAASRPATAASRPTSSSASPTPCTSPPTCCSRAASPPHPTRASPPRRARHSRHRRASPDWGCRRRKRAAPTGPSSPQTSWSRWSKQGLPWRHATIARCDHAQPHPRPLRPAWRPGGDEQDRLLRVTAASSPRQLSELASRTSGRHDLPHLAGLPVEVQRPSRTDRLRAGPAGRCPRAGAASAAPATRRTASPSASPTQMGLSIRALPPAAPSADRVARFWRGELRAVEPDAGPASRPWSAARRRLRRAGDRRARPPGEGASQAGPATPGASERPVAAAFTLDGVPFIFVNAARPVVLQRFALAHAFAPSRARPRRRGRPADRVEPQRAA